MDSLDKLTSFDVGKPLIVSTGVTLMISGRDRRRIGEDRLGLGQCLGLGDSPRE